MPNVVALLAGRREEIRAIRRLCKELAVSLGGALALHVLVEAIAAEAEAEGRRFSPPEPSEACLDHFAVVLAARDGDGGVETASAIVEDGELVVLRKRCDYPALYRQSGLSPRLVVALSCGREAAFARGYDGRVRLGEVKPPCGDDRTCRMTFYWDADAPVRVPAARTKLRLRPA